MVTLLVTPANKIAVCKSTGGLLGGGKGVGACVVCITHFPCCHTTISPFPRALCNDDITGVMSPLVDSIPFYLECSSL